MSLHDDSSSLTISLLQCSSLQAPALVTVGQWSVGPVFLVSAADEECQDVLAAVPTFISLVCDDSPLAFARLHSFVT